MIRSSFLFMILCSFLFAHKLNVFTDFENNKLYVSAYFANGNACKECKLTIKRDELFILEDKTDIKGEFEAVVNENKFQVIVDAGSGHVVIKNLEHQNLNTDIHKENKKEDSKLLNLEEENKKLKIKVKMLEEKLEQMNIYKTLFALLMIFAIFAFLKRVKRDKV